MRRLSLLPILALLLMACTPNNANGSVPVRTIESLAGDWYATNAYELPAPLVPGVPVILTVDGQDVTLKTGCNIAGGRAVVRDSRLTVNDMARTEMACEPALMAQEEWLTAMLAAHPRLERSGPFLAMHWTADAHDYSLGLSQEAAVTDAPAGPPAGPDSAPPSR